MMLGFSINSKSYIKGTNRYQKVVGQNGEGQGISGFIRQLLPEQGLSALKFWDGAEKLIVHMHWLIWLVWSPCHIYW